MCFTRSSAGSIRSDICSNQNISLARNGVELLGGLNFFQSPTDPEHLVIRLELQEFGEDVAGAIAGGGAGGGIVLDDEFGGIRCAENFFHSFDDSQLSAFNVDFDQVG